MSEVHDASPARWWPTLAAVLLTVGTLIIIGLLAMPPKNTDVYEHAPLEARAIAGEITGMATGPTGGALPTVLLSADGANVIVDGGGATVNVPLLRGVTVHIAAKSGWDGLCIATQAPDGEPTVVTLDGQFPEMPVIPAIDPILCDAATYPVTVIHTTPA